MTTAIADVARRAERLITNNSPAILTAMGVTGTIATAYLAGRAAWDAREETLRLECGDDPRYDSPLTFREGLEETWPMFVPAIATGVGTITCVILSHRISNRRAAAIAAAYSLSERAFTEYREKVKEKVGEKKEQAYRDEIAQDRVTRTDGATEIIISGNEQLCLDAYSSRYFKSTMETLRRAENDLNRIMLQEGYASLGEFYSLIGLKHTVYSTEVGWKVDNPVELRFNGSITDDGRPCMVVDFNIQPIREYDKW